MSQARIIAAALVLLTGACSSAPPKLEASDAWARETASSSTAAYLTVTNQGGTADRLLSVSSDRGVASLHVTQTENGIARMRAVPAEGLSIPASGELVLRPGGAHVMLTGLNQPLRPGESLSMKLTFEESAAIPIMVTVRPAGEVGHGEH